MDPERQWVARLEPERPVERDELDETPLGRVPRLAAVGIVAVGGLLEALGFLDEDLRVLRFDPFDRSRSPRSRRRRPATVVSVSQPMVD